MAGRLVGRQFDADDLDALVATLSVRTHRKLVKTHGLAPLRAETLVAGLVILAEVGRLLERRFTVARGGLREGAALELASALAAA